MAAGKAPELKANTVDISVTCKDSSGQIRKIESRCAFQREKRKEDKGRWFMTRAYYRLMRGGNITAVVFV